MTNFNPKVSIIIPVYNGSNYMREAIDSALAQNYGNIEVIVVNDGSIDDGKTREIALSYKDRIRYFEKENGGVATALNFGIEKMTGEYFSWLSHDDVYYSDKIEKQINFLNQQNDKKIILYSDFEYIDEKSHWISDQKIRNKKKNTLYAVLKGYIHGCTLLIPKSCFYEVGKFDEKLKTTQDYDLWFRLIREYPVIHFSIILVLSRQHNEQGSKYISTHLEEETSLYISFINRLNEQEILKLEKSMELFYFKMAFFYKRKNLVKVANYCFQKISEKKKWKLLLYKFYPLFIFRFIFPLRILIMNPKYVLNRIKEKLKCFYLMRSKCIK